jgi:hypothetical protein
MEILTFFHPVLRALENGNVIRKTVGVTLQIAGGLALAAGLLFLTMMFRDSFRMPTVEGTFGGVLFALVMALTLMCVAQVFFYRSQSIKALEGGTFTVIPVFSLLLRAAGETYAALGAGVGLGGCLFIWFARYSPLPTLGMVGSILPNYQAEATVLGGLGFLCYLLVAAVLALLFFYFLAESVLLLADIAINVRLLATPASSDASSSASSPASHGSTSSLSSLGQ